MEIPEAGTYQVGYRTAALSETGAVRLEVINENGSAKLIHRVSFPPTGDWQQWRTTWTNANLDTGVLHLRLTIEAPLFNINWFEFTTQSITSSEDSWTSSEMVVYPNPTHGTINIQMPGSLQTSSVQLEILDITGRPVYDNNLSEETSSIKLSLPSGLYILRFWGSEGILETTKLRIY